MTGERKLPWRVMLMYQEIDGGVYFSDQPSV